MQRWRAAAPLGSSTMGRLPAPSLARGGCRPPQSHGAVPICYRCYPIRLARDRCWPHAQLAHLSFWIEPGNSLLGPHERLLGSIHEGCAAYKLGGGAGPLKAMMILVASLSISAQKGEFGLVVDLPMGADQVVGRDASADITVPDRAISRRHARLSHDEDGVWLEDLGSTNGTYVNGARVTNRCRLHNEDEVKLGDSVAIFHEVTSSPVTTSPDEAVLRLSCPRCSATSRPDLWFCAHCGYQQRPITLESTAESAAGSLTSPDGRMEPHAIMGREAFRQAMRASNGGRRVPYNEGLAIPTIAFRVFAAFAAIVVIVVSLVLTAKGVL